MDNELIQAKLDKALGLYDEGKSYSHIRQHFSAELDDETISYIIRLVDEFVIEESKIQEDLKKAKFKMRVGAIAFILSSFLLYLLYENKALEGITVQWIYSVMMLVQYFPIVFSVYFLWKTHQEETRLKKTEPEIDDTKFRLKRRGKK